MRGGNLEVKEYIRNARGKSSNKRRVLRVQGGILEVKENIRSARRKSRGKGEY